MLSAKGWTREEIRIARAMWAKGATNAEVGEATGHTQRQALYLYECSPERVQKHEELAGPIEVPDNVVEDWLRRDALPHTISSMLMGDPKPGEERWREPIKSAAKAA